jgi:myo-inositol-1(or 4)-monophosphatase
MGLPTVWPYFMRNKSSDYLPLMLSMASKAGKVAMTYLDKSAPSLKKDASVITKADKEISKLCHKALAHILKDPSHLLLDEEDPRMGEYLNQQRLDKTSYLWAIDPIDGTRLYANRMPMFGISLGLLKDLKPWLGVVYFPVLKELFYCDGKEAYYVQNAFTSNEIRTKIKPRHEQLSPKSIFFCNDTFFNRFNWKDKDFHIMINACAVVNLCWPAIGRGVGCFMKSNLWDFAGSWPIMRKAGFDFRSVKTGKLMDRVHVDLFNTVPKAWELKEYYLVSSATNYSPIKSRISFSKS